MKTSNKILLGLVAFVFLSPLVMAKILKGVVERNEYVVEKVPEAQDEPAESFKMPAGKYSVVKFTGTPAYVHFHLRWRDSASFGYLYNTDHKSDRPDLICANDTLFVNYKVIPDSVVTGNSREYIYQQRQLSMNVTNEVQSIVSEGPHVTIDEPVVLMNPLMISLRNYSKLNITSFVGDKEGEFQTVKINSEESSVSINTAARIPVLDLNMTGRGDLDIGEGVYIKSLKGRIGDSISVSGNWRLLKGLSSSK